MPSQESLQVTSSVSDDRTMDLPVQTRAAVLSGVNVDSRTITFSFSSEAPAEKMFGTEILSHDKGAVVTNRLDKKAVSLLLDHDWTKPIGKIQSYSIEGGRAYATAKLSRSPLASEVLMDMADGLRTEVSVGYLVHEMKMIKASDESEGDTYLVTSWEPLEISSVSVPSDASVGLGRTADTKLYSVRILGGGTHAPVEEAKKSDPESELSPDEVQQRDVVKETVVTTEEIISGSPVIKKVQDSKPLLSTEPTSESYTVAYKEEFGEPNPLPAETPVSETKVSNANADPLPPETEIKASNLEPAKPPQVEVRTTIPMEPVQHPAIEEAVISQNISSKSQKTIMSEELAENQRIEIIKENEDSLNKIRDTEHSRIREITALGKKFDCEGDASEWIRRGKTIQEFHSHILNNKVFSSAPIRSMDPSLGMRPAEQKRYCLTRAILANSEGKLSGFELECSKELEAQVGRKAAGFFVPEFAFSNMGHRASPPDLTALTTSEGKETIQTSVEPSLIPFLRNHMVLGRAGCTMMGGLVGNMALPRQISAATATWNTETFDPTRTGQTFDQVQLNPQRLSAVTAFSKQLLAQSQLDVQTVVRDDLMKIIAIAQDLAGLSGTGINNQPTGILTTTADTVFPSSYAKTSPSIVFASGFPTWTNVVAFEGNVESNNVNLDDPSCCYIMSPAVKALWKTLSKTDPRASTSGASYYPNFIWEEGNDLVGRVNGYKSLATAQVAATNQVIFGKFSDLVIGTWGGIDLITDPYTLASSFQIRVIINLLTTIALRYGPSFCYSTNSGLT